MAKYVIAGGSTLNQLCKTLTETNISTVDKLRNFFTKTTSYLLTSIGEVLSKKQTFDKDRFIKNVVKHYTKVYESPWFKDPMQKVVDSGGYQISVGYITDYDSLYNFIDAYIDLLNHPKVGQTSSYMLSLDIVADYPIIKTLEDLKNFNELSLQKTLENPNKDKVALVYHFINPKLEEFWWNIIEKYVLSFKHYSIGGLVAFNRSNSFPLNVYILPLLKILRKRVDNQIYEPFIFHILGVSAFTDIALFVLFEKAVKHFYGIDVNINFDSTRAIRETSIAKRFQFFYDNHLMSIDYKSSLLNQRCYKSFTNADMIVKVLEYLSSVYGFDIDIPRPLTAKDIYKDNGNGSIKKHIESLFILASIESLQQTVNFVTPIVEDLFKAFINNDETHFEQYATYLLEVANFNKRTKSLVHKIRSLKNTLNLIALKPDYNTLKPYMLRALEDVYDFQLFDKQRYENLASIL